jgi:hypothetical protein
VGPDGHGESAWHIVGTITWIVFLVAVLVLGVLIARQLLTRPMQPSTPYTPPRSPALDELDLRFARGEIAREEYLGRRNDLLATAGLLWPGFLPAKPPPGPPPPAGPPPDAPAA